MIDPPGIFARFVAPAQIELTPEACAWRDRSQELTDWTMAHMVNRTDVYGRYRDDGGVFTAKDGLTSETINRHLRTVTQKDIIGLHTTIADSIQGPDGGAIVSCTSKWSCNDIDHHDPGPVPPANETAARVWHELATMLGFRTLTLETSPGGYRNLIIFTEAIQTCLAFDLIRWLQRDWRELGLATEPETFPKQRHIDVGAFGNWVRLPGRHPLKEHYTRVWNGLEWLAGDDAIDWLIGIDGNDPALIPNEVRQWAKSTPDVGRVWESAETERPQSFNPNGVAATRVQSPTPATFESRSDPGNSWEGMEVPPPSAPTTRPGDELAASMDWKDLLPGWTWVGEVPWTIGHRSGVYQKVRRPGKDSGHSATIGYGGDWLHVFTDKTSFKQGQTYSKFGVWATLNCGGDFSLAMKKLRAMGFGAPSTNAQPAVVNVDDDDSVSLDVRPWPDPPGDVAFHGLAGEVARLIEPNSEADLVGVLLHFLIGFGNAVGRGTWVVADGHSHFLSEFIVTVGDTSRARKGTAWRRVRPILAHADVRWADNKITGGLSSGEGLIWEIRDPIYGVNKNTGETIVTDPGVDDKRLMVVEQEFGNVLRVLAREANTLSGVLRLGWDGDNLRTMTKNSPARASNPHVSLIGHVTAEELTRYLSHVEIFNGLGNRILWVCVRRSKSLAFGGSVDPQAVCGLGNRLALALDNARQKGVMDWTPSGKTLWESSYDVLTESRPGLWGAITSRAEAHVLRLGLIFVALDRADKIADTHVLAALELWRFCDRSAAYLFGGSVGDRDADAILAVLRAKPQGMTRTEVNVGVFNKNRPSRDITRALELLLRYRLARCESACEGRPERWFAAIPGSTATNCTSSTK
jgi:hypothetical protein